MEENILESTNLNLMNSNRKSLSCSFLKTASQLVGGVHEFIIYNMFTDLCVLI